ncbi:MAG: futalosine hydrolase [bacterium]|nr:futalosine hydrolase [bacterium]
MTAKQKLVWYNEPEWRVRLTNRLQRRNLIKHPVHRLVLVPSQLELDHLQDSRLIAESPVELCGFGLVAAAMRTMQLLSHYQPQQVLLIGIAGGLTEHIQVGQAYCFDSVACYGIGVGTGKDFCTAGQMGWRQLEQPIQIGDQLDLRQNSAGRLLLSCAAASGNPDDVDHRLAAFPQAEAEDMEAFAVAAACRLAKIPLTVIRGISNRAGHRDHREWKIADAMCSAREVAEREMR